jgi:hypothetical protein
VARSRRTGRVGDDTVVLQRSSIMIRNEDEDLLELPEPEGAEPLSRGNRIEC